MTTTDQAALAEGADHAGHTSLEQVREDLARRSAAGLPYPTPSFEPHDGPMTVRFPSGRTVTTGVATPPAVSAYQPPTYEERVQRHLEHLREQADENDAIYEVRVLFNAEREAARVARKAAA